MQDDLTFILLETLCQMGEGVTAAIERTGIAGCGHSTGPGWGLRSGLTAWVLPTVFGVP